MSLRTGRQSFPGGACAALLAVLLAAAASAEPAAAQGRFGKNKVHYQAFDWHVYRAPHFDVYFYPEGEAFLEQVVSYAESAYLQLSRALDHEPRFRVPLIYYRTHGEFEQTNVELATIPEAVAAFAEPLQHRVLLSIDKPPDKLYELLLHELTHIFEFSILFHDSFGRAVRGNPPQWLMEGLASYMAKDEDNLDRMIIRDAVINGLVPPITKFPPTGFLAYRYGHAAFGFIESKWGAEGLRTFLSEYRKVLLTTNVEKSIKEAFGIEADEFDRLFQRYLRQKYLPALLAKAEPEDYGKEVGIKLPGVMTFSPVLSPSGELIAVLTNRYYELDVVILSAKDGEVIKNLTRGFTNDYDYVSTAVFEGKTDLSWSPDGDTVAFFVRAEDRRLLLLVNALTGREVKTLDAKAANAASPAYSPDGKKMLFSGNVDGVVDLFEINVETGELRNLTNDEYYDSNPSWSADGKTILYNRRVGAYEKIFLLDYEDPSRRTQVTFGPANEITPWLTRDGKRVLYCSDAGDDGIFNVYSLDLETGEIRRYTDVVGGYFHPQERPSEEGRERVVATAFFKGRLRLYEVDITKPIQVISPGERAEETAEVKPFEPPLKLTLDDDAKRPYARRQYHVETSPTIGVGVANDGTIFGDAAVIFSDLLGDHRFWVYLTSVASFQNTDAGYINLKSRTHHYYRFSDYRDFLLVPLSTNTFTRVRANRITDLTSGLIHPINSYYRVEANVGVASRDVLDPRLIQIDDPNTSKTGDFAFLSLDFLESTTAVVGASFVGDTLRYNPWGPWHGKRFNLSVTSAPFASGRDPATFANYSLDYRAYGRVSRRSLFALRLETLVTEGDGATLFGIGGFNQLRGYRFREFIGDRAAWANLEFRFPLVDDLRFPFGSIRWIRGLLFLDVGAAWTQDGFFFDREMGRLQWVACTGSATPDCGLVSLSPGVFRGFKFYDSSVKALRDGRASYGLGFNFRLGILELNWTFAKRLPFSQIDRSTCLPALTSIPCTPDLQGSCVSIDPEELAAALNECTFEKVSASGWRSDFYIGYSF